MISYPTRPIKVAINAQFVQNKAVGGVERVVAGLIHALGQLSDGDEQYQIIHTWNKSGWLKPYIGPNQTLVEAPLQQTGRPFNRFPVWLRSLARRFDKVLNLVVNPPWPGYQVPISDGFYEKLNPDVIHFPKQNLTICALPTVYNPHDLQHLHLPKFFTPADIAYREATMRYGCQYARTVAVASSWIKKDISEQYQIDLNKIQVIPWAPPSAPNFEPSAEDFAKVSQKYAIKMPFVFYPAMLWPHKNHLGLISAFALAQKKANLSIGLVCTGSENPELMSVLKSKIQELNLSATVQFLGSVSAEELKVLYRLAHFVIVPTLFEAASAPVFEAWLEKAPVACSSVTSLPEQAGDAALLFNPYSIDEIAAVIIKMTSDQKLRENLVQNGNKRLKIFSWERTAKAYRAVYRRLARVPLTEEDVWLLNHDWIAAS